MAKGYVIGVLFIIAGIALALFGGGTEMLGEKKKIDSVRESIVNSAESANQVSVSGSDSTEKGQQIATFSGGCFWCSESDFEKHVGVIDAVSGYAGGDELDPTYKQVSSGSTGHRESVQVIYDSEKISYPELLDIFWRHINPTDSGGQFVDRGFQYTSAIFYHSEEQKRLAAMSLEALNKSGRFTEEIITPIIPFKTFYPAEDYHQDYHKENSLKYKFYRSRSGRDQYIDSVWGKEEFNTDYENRINELTDIQYKVTQEDGTEKAFDNEYWDNTAEGIYVDIVSGEPLYSSIDKYKSGTGWPSFTKPLVPENIVEKEDKSFFTTRTEIRSKNADSHLGHVFNDGPSPTGLRYCMNSAALRFVAKENMQAQGYGEFLYLFG